MTCLQSCWGLHNALTYADAYSDLGHPRESLRWAILRGTRRFLYKNKQIDLAHERISNASLCISCVRDTAAKSGFLATISHNMKFSMDTVLKSEGIISHKHFLTTFVFLHSPWCSFHYLFSVQGLLETSIFADKHECAL